MQFHFNWEHISAVAGMSRANFLFRLYDGAVKGLQVVEFLKALRAHIRRKLLIVWDGAGQHKGRVVRDFLDSTKDAIQMAPASRLLTRAEPCGIPLGLAQAPCAGQLLSGLAAGAQDHGAGQAQERPAPAIHHHRVLEASRPLVMSWVT